MGKRRSSRELAIKFLYLMEMNPGDTEKQLEQFWESNPCQDDIQNYTVELLAKIREGQPAIDNLLKKFSENWTLDRMAVIDRNLLRLAACELMYDKSIPPKVVIDEAVEIAKKYGSGESPNFINGILDRVMKEMDDVGAPTPTKQ